MKFIPNKKLPETYLSSIFGLQPSKTRSFGFQVYIGNIGIDSILVYVFFDGPGLLGKNKLYFVFFYIRLIYKTLRYITTGSPKTMNTNMSSAKTTL